MVLRRFAVLPLLVALLGPFLPSGAAAATIPPGHGIVLDWPRGPDAAVRIVVIRAPGPIARVRVLTLDLALLPAERTIAALVARRPVVPLDVRPARAAAIVLPLPGALPLMLGALAGLAMIARRRARTGLAGQIASI